MKILNLFVVALIAVFLSGCVTVPEYKVDPNTPRAGLRIVGVPTKVDVNIATDLSCISEKGTKIVILGETANTFTNFGVDKKIGIPLGESAPKKASTEIYIPADKPFGVEMIGTWGISWTYFGFCKKLVEFTPKSGKNYELTYVLDGHGDNVRCDVTLQSIEDSGSNKYVKVAEPNVKASSNMCVKK